MAHSYSELAKLTDQELIESYDQIARSTSVGLNFYSTELRARRLDRAGEKMERMTSQILILSWVLGVVGAIQFVVLIKEIVFG